MQISAIDSGTEIHMKHRHNCAGRSAAIIVLQKDRVVELNGSFGSSSSLDYREEGFEDDEGKLVEWVPLQSENRNVPSAQCNVRKVKVTVLNVWSNICEE